MNKDKKYSHLYSLYHTVHYTAVPYLKSAIRSSCTYDGLLTAWHKPVTIQGVQQQQRAWLTMIATIPNRKACFCNRAGFIQKRYPIWVAVEHWIWYNVDSYGNLAVISTCIRSTIRTAILEMIPGMIGPAKRFPPLTSRILSLKPY